MSRGDTERLEFRCDFGSIILPVVLESRREVPVARAALRESFCVGLTTFAPGLYHVMSREG